MNIQFIDLFCGAGGLGEGFKQAGFNSAIHIDSDKWAIDTVRLREIYYQLKSQKKLDTYYESIKESNGLLSPELFQDNDSIDMDAVMSKASHLRINESSIKSLIMTIKTSHNNNCSSVIIGGPPCQAYSLAKRSRMRKPLIGLMGDDLVQAKDEHKTRIEKYLTDKRHALFEHYLKIIYDIKPAAFVYENVPGILTAEKKSGKKSTDKIINLFNEDLNKKAGGYEFISVDSPEHSQIPLGIDDETRNFKDFIVDSSDYGIPQKRKRFILIGIRKDLANNQRCDFREIFHSAVLQYKVTEQVRVKDAIMDLPAINSGQGNDFFLKGEYGTNSSDYSNELACPDLGGIINHFARKHMASDLDRYRFFAEYADKNKMNATLHTLVEKNKSLLPEHESAKDVLSDNTEKKKSARYIDRFKVQLKEKPASTITAHIAKDGHAFIHPSIEQNRSLTVREAARLQSFPDDYAFCGPRTEQFKQVGNAVPVILAKVIAMGIKKVLESCHGR
jgi:DNA (cytosine-5)-methyltransferase 1